MPRPCWPATAPPAARLAPALCALLAPALAGCGADGDGDDKGGATGWILPAEDLGGPWAQGASATFEDGAAMWRTAEHIVPGLRWTDPGVDIPLYLWDLLQTPAIGDEGSCPYAVAEGAGLLWRSDCLSEDGYQWAGTAQEQSWTDEATGIAWQRWDWDLSVTADREDPSFRALTLRGAAVFGLGGERSPVERAVQANVLVQLDGFWEQANVADPLEQAWQELALTSRSEEAPTGTFHIGGAGYLQGIGAFTYEAPELVQVPDCGLVPDGDLRVVGAQEHTLAFAASSSCARCADWGVDGAFNGRACGG
jgi:hypothetical protein